MTTSSSLSYLGIDFANIEKNVGNCLIDDDGQTLSARFTDKVPHVSEVRLTAIDCPLGTSQGFEMGLRGELSDVSEDGWKTRLTERTLRSVVEAYATNQAWKTAKGQLRTKAARAQYSGPYFHPTSHIQPSVGMVIVPALLQFVGRQLCPDGKPDRRLEAIREARAGNGPIVEAHPRLFLYSLLERTQQSGQPIPLETLRAAARYKVKDSEEGLGDLTTGSSCRRHLLDFILRHPEWTGIACKRTISVDGALEKLIEDDHAFDAWLSALTAWAHARQETLTWAALRMPEDVSRAEGHILVLRQGKGVDTQAPPQ